MNHQMKCLLVYVASLFLTALGILCVVEPVEAQKQMEIRVLPTPPQTGGNSFYVGNRSPLLPSPLIKLPIGSIQPEGWLRHQLKLMADGFTGNLMEISKWCRLNGSAWASTRGEGRFGWEELPYWLRGYIDLGYVLKNERVIAQAGQWVEAVLSTQESSGYFGPRTNRDNYDIWPNMVILYALRSYYEATGDERVISLMTKYFRWLITIPLEQFLPGSWQKWRGGDNLDHIYWLYNHTGGSWLLDLARLNHERTADWTGGIPTWHGVNICQGFREPAEYYQQTHDVRYLKATERNYDSVMNIYGQVPGGMFAADEDCRPGYTGPRQAAETCSMVEFMHSFEMMTEITGNLLWADRCEEVAFNSLPAAMTPDLKGLHYLTAPNMVQLDTANKAPLLENDGDMLSYNPWQYRCCQHNVAFGWPYFSENLWMATQGNGIAAVLFAPCEAQAKVGNGAEVKITETTDYPFGEVVDFKFSLAEVVRFPFVFRVPGWCKDIRVQVNGESVKLQANPLTWVVIERVWKDNDNVRLELPMEISIRLRAKNAISLYRGPLAYSFKIGERWQRYGGSETWPSFQLFSTTPWNYGLIADLKNPAAFFQVVRKNGPLASQPFTPDNAPIELQAKGKWIPQWQLETNGLMSEIQESPVLSTEPVVGITLIPMGCARLRVSVFPTISESKDAHIWK